MYEFYRNDGVVALKQETSLGGMGPHKTFSMRYQQGHVENRWMKGFTP